MARFSDKTMQAVGSLVREQSRRDLAGRLQEVAEVVLYDHELRSEYLTDEERELIIEALKK